MSNDQILQEIHEDFISSIEYQKFLWEINNTPPTPLSEN
jgi:hypothetical protein